MKHQKCDNFKKWRVIVSKYQKPSAILLIQTKYHGIAKRKQDQEE